MPFGPFDHDHKSGVSNSFRQCSNPWRDLEHKLNRAQQSVLGELFVAMPQLSRANRPTVADPIRPEFQFLAVLISPSAEVATLHRNTKFAVTEPCLQITMADLPYSLLQGDKVRQYTTGKVFIIRSVKPNGHGTADLPLIDG